MADQPAHALAQPAHHLGQLQDHLHRRISVGGHLFELSHSSLRFNLIWFLHSGSPFSRERKFALSLARLRAESRYFLRSRGHSLGRCESTTTLKPNGPWITSRGADSSSRRSMTSMTHTDHNNVYI